MFRSEISWGAFEHGKRAFSARTHKPGQPRSEAQVLGNRQRVRLLLRYTLHKLCGPLYTYHIHTYADTSI